MSACFRFAAYAWDFIKESCFVVSRCCWCTTIVNISCLSCRIWALNPVDMMLHSVISCLRLQTFLMEEGRCKSLSQAPTLSGMLLYSGINSFTYNHILALLQVLIGIFLLYLSALLYCGSWAGVSLWLALSVWAGSQHVQQMFFLTHGGALFFQCAL